MQMQTRTAEPLSRPAAHGRVASGIPAPAIPSPAAPVHEALAVLEQFGTRQAVRRGHEFYAAGDAARFCYRIVSGSVRTVGLDEDGRRQIAEFLLPGDLLGFDSLDTHHLSAEALTDTVVLRYPRGVIDTLAEQHGALALRLRSLTMQNLRRAHEKMFLLGRKSASERIASFLLEMAARAPGQGQGAVDLPMPRADIADHLGLTIETVSRNIAQLCRDGTVAVTRSGIEIRDRDALEAFGTDTRH